MNACRVIGLSVLFAALPSFFAQSQPQTSDVLQKLSDDFWSWRAKFAPFTGDDVNRIERPGGTRDWSRVEIDKQRKALEQFEARRKKIDTNGWPIAEQVDYQLIGSALARVWTLIRAGNAIQIFTSTKRSRQWSKR